MAMVDSVLARARQGHGDARILSGEAGIGRSALLDHVVTRADDFTVVRVTCHESESGFGYAVLDQLARPLLEVLAGIPSAQREALEAALGLRNVSDPDPFLVSTALLSMLARATDGGPALCVVDDAQWCDPQSWQALTFAARRVTAHPVVLLLSVRADALPDLDVSGIEVNVLERLSCGAVRKLVRERLPGASEDEIDDIATWGQGNPLALLEATSAYETAIGEPVTSLSDEVEVSGALRRRFQGEVRRVCAEGQLLLLIAAADRRAGLAEIDSCARTLGLPTPRLLLDDLDSAGFVNVVDDRVVFRHPLVQSVVLQTLPRAQRRTVHHAYAGQASIAADPERLAWHLMHAHTAPNESVAAALESAALRSSSRAVHEPASWALVKAANFSDAPRAKARRLALAAETAWTAGLGETARRISARTERSAVDSDVQVRLDHLEALVELRCGVPIKAYAGLRGLSDRIVEVDPSRAGRVLLSAVEAAWLAGQRELVVSAGLRAQEMLSEEPDVSHLHALVATGFTQVVYGDLAKGRAQCDRATDLAIAGAADPEDLLAGAWAAAFAGRIDSRYALASDALSACQSRGQASLLPIAYEHAAAAETQLGLLSNARATASAGLSLARELNQEAVLAHLLPRLALVEAMTGDHEACEAHANEALSIAGRLGIDLWEAGANAVLAHMDLSQGRACHAARRLTHLVCGRAGADPHVVHATPDAIEAAVRCGDRAMAQNAIVRYRRFASRGPGWASAIHARCEALLASPSEAEAWFERALSCHSSDSRKFEMARTQLLYGEHLRRQRRRVDARSMLQLAAETFERHGCEPWLERALVELRAAGEPGGNRPDHAATAITPQELEITKLVADGLTNREIAGHLFVSPKTVAYHLAKLYRRLQIASRSQLAARYREGGLRSSSPTAPSARERRPQSP